MNSSIKFILVVITISFIDQVITTPFLEYVSNSKMTFLGLLWFSDIFLLASLINTVSCFIDRLFTFYKDKFNEK